MTDPLHSDPNYRFAHALFMARWWLGMFCPGVSDVMQAMDRCWEAIGWSAR